VRRPSLCEPGSVRLVRANRVDWLFGPGHVAALETSTAARFKAAQTRGKVRRFTQFYDAAESWSWVNRLNENKPYRLKTPRELATAIPRTND